MMDLTRYRMGLTLTFATSFGIADFDISTRFRNYGANSPALFHSLIECCWHFRSPNMRATDGVHRGIDIEQYRIP